MFQVTNGIIVHNLLPLIDALERGGWERTRTQRATKQRDQIEWWSLPDGQRIRVDFYGEAVAVGRHRIHTLIFLNNLDTSSEEAIARAGGCWTGTQIDATRNEGNRIYYDKTRSVEERAEGLLLEIRGVYQRDRCVWVGDWRVYRDTAYQHPPDEATYAAHWLAVHSERIDPAVRAILKQRYPLRGKPHIKPDSTMFHPQPVDGTARTPSRRR